MAVQVGQPTIKRVTLTNANTEYSYSLPTGTKSFSMEATTSAAVRYAFMTGLVAGPTGEYMTMKSDGAYNSPENGSDAVGEKTVYLASATAGTVVNIISWK